MEEKDLLFILLCICIIILPFAVMTWREGNKRIYKHILYWTIIMLVAFLMGKTLKGSFLPPEQSARPRGALLENTDRPARHPLTPYHSLE